MIRMLYLKLCALLILLIAGACFAGEYRVQSGDTLSSIAQKELGSSSRWKEIAELNKIKEPYTIKIGQALKMPGSYGGDNRDASNELEELIRSSEKANESQKDKPFYWKNNPIVLWLIALLGSIFFYAVIIILISSLALYFSCKTLNIKGSFGKCFLVAFITQSIGILLQIIFEEIDPHEGNPQIVVSLVLGIILLYLVMHIYLIKRIINCKVSKAIMAFLVSIAFYMVVSVLFVLIVALIIGAVSLMVG